MCPHEIPEYTRRIEQMRNSFRVQLDHATDPVFSLVSPAALKSAGGKLSPDVDQSSGFTIAAICCSSNIRRETSRRLTHTTSDQIDPGLRKRRNSRSELIKSLRVNLFLTQEQR